MPEFIDIDYQTVISPDKLTAAITGCARFRADAPCALLYDLAADGHELLPNGILRLSPGENTIELPVVRIVRPSPGFAAPITYCLRFRYGTSGETLEPVEKTIPIGNTP